MNTEDIPNKGPSPWQPEQDRRKLAVYGKAIEEGGEFTTILGRIIIQGIDGLDPATQKPNRKALSEEIGDILAQCQRLIADEQLDQEVILSRAERKFVFMHKWLETLCPDHDGWYDVNRINIPPEAIKSGMMIGLWIQPADALDDIVAGEYIPQAVWNLIDIRHHSSTVLANNWIAAYSDQLVTDIVDADHLQRLSSNYRVTHWRYYTNEPTCTPTLTTA